LGCVLLRELVDNLRPLARMTLLGLRIVQADGSSLDRRHAIVRLIAFPLGFLTLGLGFLGIIFGRTHQAIYDRIAKTAVVYDWDAEVAKLRSLAARGVRRREAQVQAPTEH
jgi:RDD family